jgi:hypothetical protein
LGAVIHHAHSNFPEKTEANYCLSGVERSKSKINRNSGKKRRNMVLTGGSASVVEVVIAYCLSAGHPQLAGIIP